MKNLKTMKRNLLPLLLITVATGLWSQIVFGQPRITHRVIPGKVRIQEVEKNSYYEKAGFKSGDIILEIGGEKVDENTTSSAIDRGLAAGNSFKILRCSKKGGKKVRDCSQSEGKVITVKPPPMPEAADGTEEISPPN